MKAIGIIPARYRSTRFPGKPLADIKGKPMIQRVYEQASKALDYVWVATDDERIYEAVAGFQGRVVMTSTDHQSGTSRCNEAYALIQKQIGETFDVVVNIQGDEPLLKPEQIDEILSGIINSNTSIATLIKRIEQEETLNSPHTPKVVKDGRDVAIYFSRQPIPYLKDLPQKKWYESYPYYSHVGMYAYTTEMLSYIVQLPAGALEKAEDLEQLRWVEHGISIQTVETRYTNLSVDTPEELNQILQYF